MSSNVSFRAENVVNSETDKGWIMSYRDSLVKFWI